MRGELGPLRIWWGADKSLYLGPGYVSDLHACDASKLCIALQGVLRWRAMDCRAEGSACFIPSGCEHELDCAATQVAIVYVDDAHRNPEAPLLRTIQTRTIPESARTMLCSLLSGGEPEQTALTWLAPLVQPPVVLVSDPKIDALQAIVDAHFPHVPPIADLAREVGVSRSWLTHNFSRVTGRSLRRYILWKRLRRACELGFAGGSLSEAAHRAGFADGAHFSRTYRAEFGIAPARLFELRDRIYVRPWS